MINENFLKEIGLDNMPPEQKEPFLAHIYSELEKRVGDKLSDGLSTEQLEEFAEITNKNQAVINKFLSQDGEDYQNSEPYQRLAANLKLSLDDPRLREEYAATRWLITNRPDYESVVAGVIQELKTELTANKDAILGDTAN